MVSVLRCFFVVSLLIAATDALADGVYLCQKLQSRQGLVLIVSNSGRTASLPISGSNEVLVNTGRRVPGEGDQYVLFRGSRQASGQVYEFAALLSQSLVRPGSTLQNQGVVGALRQTDGVVLSCKNFAGRG